MVIEQSVEHLQCTVQGIDLTNECFEFRMKSPNCHCKIQTKTFSESILW